MRDADRGVLAFAAAHHLVLAEQVALLLGADAAAARKRLARLHLAGLIRRTRMLAIKPRPFAALPLRRDCAEQQPQPLLLPSFLHPLLPYFLGYLSETSEVALCDV